MFRTLFDLIGISWKVFKPKGKATKVGTTMIIDI